MSRTSRSARPSRSTRRFSRRPSRSSRAASISGAKPGSPASARPATQRARCPPRRRPRAPLGPGGLGPGRCAASQGQCPHQSRVARRDRRDRGGSHYRRARRHLRGGNPILARFRPRPYHLHFRPAHGDHGGHRVLARAGAARSVPALALRYPIKKWAAASALAAATFYLALSGAAVPRAASGPTFSSSGRGPRRRCGRRAAISSFRRRPPGYSVDNWLLADGDDRDATAAADEGVFRCDLSAALGRSRARPWRSSAIRARSRRIAAWPISSSRPSPSARSAAPRA